MMVKIHSDVMSETAHSCSTELFDCIATCFFLDTAKNVVAYVETIHRLLKPGGLWVNVGTTNLLVGNIFVHFDILNTGPLLYHWSEMPGEISIELSWEELKQVILSFGFTIEVIWRTCNLQSLVTFLAERGKEKVPLR